MSRRLVALLAVSSGAAVANLYYAQPLLHTLSRELSVSSATAGLLVTISQAGYVAGLILLVPLGDLVERRRLLIALLLAVAVSEAGAAAAPGFALFAVATALASFSAVVAQVVVPLSSNLAAEEERGRVVGTVMSGLLIGILLARTASGLIAGLLGWRAVFIFAAATMLVLPAVLARALPRSRPEEELSYGRLLGSVASIVREEPLLRQRMAVGAAGFGCFSVLWTCVAFLLSARPYGYGNIVIGLFGLAGAAGAVAAPVAGRLADRGRGAATTTATLLLLLASWGLILLGKSSLLALIAGIALLDFAVQGAHIANQSAIYSLKPEARSRLTTAYMVGSFTGGALLSALSAAVYSSSGWAGVCGLGAATAAVGVGIWALTELRMRGRRRARLAAQPAER